MIFTNALTILYLILGYLHTCYIHYKKKLKIILILSQLYMSTWKYNNYIIFKKRVERVYNNDNT